MSQGIHPRVRYAVAMMVLCGTFLFATTTLAGTTPAGQWIGEVKTPDGDKVDINLSLSKEGTTWSGALEDPTMGETIVSNLKVTETRISFTFKPASAPFPLHFSGSYIAGDDRVTGTFSLHGNSRFVRFKRVPGSEQVAVSANAEPKIPARIRHDYNFGFTGRVNYWLALHVTQDDVLTMNDLTRATPNFDVSVKWFVMDGFNIFARYYRGGFNFTDDPLKLDPFAGMGLNGESYLKLDGIEFGVMGYLGNIMMPNSKFNPYLTGSLGQTSWSLAESGRGSDPIADGLYPFEGDNLAASFGIGTEYEITQKMALEFEWAWRYFMTEDDEKWPNPEEVWSNSHAWSLSAGFTIGF